MTIMDAVRTAGRELSATSDSPTLDAEVLMRHLLGWNRTDYLMHRNQLLDEDTSRAFSALIERMPALSAHVHKTAEARLADAGDTGKGDLAAAELAQAAAHDDQPTDR